jgi:hypothetical protein
VSQGAETKAIGVPFRNRSPQRGPTSYEYQPFILAVPVSAGLSSLTVIQVILAIVLVLVLACPVLIVVLEVKLMAALVVMVDVATDKNKIKYLPSPSPLAYAVVVVCPTIAVTNSVKVGCWTTADYR